MSCPPGTGSQADEVDGVVGYSPASGSLSAARRRDEYLQRLSAVHQAPSRRGRGPGAQPRRRRAGPLVGVEGPIAVGGYLPVSAARSRTWLGVGAFMSAKVAPISLKVISEPSVPSCLTGYGFPVVAT